MIILILLLLIVAIVFAAKSYNTLQGLVQNVREKDSNVQVAVRKKLSLVNQMIDLVKNYQEGEQFVQLKISQESNSANLVSAYQQSATMLTSMQGVAERFPNLKANEQYNNLSSSISHCEHDVQSYSVAYNNAVRSYNTIRLKIPTIFLARFMGFPEAPYAKFDISGINDVTSLKEFKTDDGERLQQLLSDAGKHVSGAAKVIANQASQAGKRIGEKINDQKRHRE